MMRIVGCTSSMVCAMLALYMLALVTPQQGTSSQSGPRQGSHKLRSPREGNPKLRSLREGSPKVTSPRQDSFWPPALSCQKDHVSFLKTFAHMFHTEPHMDQTLSLT